ncbi:NYN domain-containing protein [Bordetella genomosp. 11]|uniref:HTH OST-type domain-containing protein n=1 Tax=Bordetella genomosp. 11 TaxID=1416808 RepID=A0A261UK82_9BORD|nr:NYN domain-containing protein [Bordetella genomosp. 11]OZI62296.1 hypothetical protein CAL28_24150 [Bordetella genomosp. 11]
MISSHDNVSMALFCDFENVALGVRDANYEKFDIRLVLERLLLKGSIVIKKAYCDWDRYKAFKAPMHEANFELIEIPHVRQSGKNSADIRLVVDALDLCYTKSHVNTFVIISGDSDFSPLVSKLRENAKHVIGVGVKHSTSDLLIANCDEFIFYDDLVRENARSSARAAGRDSGAGGRRGGDDRKRKEDTDTRKSQAIDIAVETFDALVAERGDSGKIWASALKDAIKRRKPDFNESYYGFRAFGNLLEEAQARGLLEVGRDEKSGTYVYRSTGVAGEQASSAPYPVQAGTRDTRSQQPQAAQDTGGASSAPAPGETGAQGPQDKPKRGGRRRSRSGATTAAATPQEGAQAATPNPSGYEAPYETMHGTTREATRQAPHEASYEAPQEMPFEIPFEPSRDASRDAQASPESPFAAEAPAAKAGRGGRTSTASRRSRARTTDTPPPASAMDAPLPAFAPDTPQAAPAVAIHDEAPADAKASKPRTARKTAARPRRARKAAPSGSET